MTISILRLDPQSAATLGPSDPEIFDHPLDPARLQAFVACPTHLLVVACDAGRVIGQIRAMLHLQPDGPTQLYIDNLGVAPTHLRQGIARRLLAEALLWGKAQGCAEAWVATEPDNAAARALYAGFMTEPEGTASVFLIALS